MQITKIGIHFHMQLGKDERNSLQGLGEKQSRKKKIELSIWD